MKSITNLFKTISSLFEKVIEQLFPSNKSSPQIKSTAKNGENHSQNQISNVDIHIESLTVVLNSNNSNNGSYILENDKTREQKSIDFR